MRDSNSHMFAHEPPSKRWQYQLCLIRHLAPEVGFEPTRRLITDLSVFKTDPFSLLGTLAFYGGSCKSRTYLVRATTLHFPVKLPTQKYVGVELSAKTHHFAQASGPYLI